MIVIRNVYRGWSIAAIGPGDEVEYTIKQGDKTIGESYDSVLTFIKLYCCSKSRVETDAYPMHTMFTISEIDDGISFSIRDMQLETTFDELYESATAALRTIVSQLDEESTPEQRSEALENIAEKMSTVDSAEELCECIEPLSESTDLT